MSGAPVIQLNDIVLKYGPLTVLDRISIDFQEGEFFALLGPSGCGKSSLLRIMAGFNEPTSGEMLLDGKDLIKVPARKRPVNMMFQSYALFPHMTVEKNIRYGLEMSRLPEEEIDRRAREILEATHLMEYAQRRPNMLSGGQRQRVALARALVMRPRVVLLDEPLGALDKKLREAMQLELKRLQNEMGITFIVVTHDQEEAMVMADRIALMRSGIIEQIGSPMDLYERPISRFVADFVGKTNFFEGEARDGRIEVSGLGQLGADVKHSGKVSCSVRPEHMRVTNARPADADQCFEGIVEEIVYHGQDENLHVRLPGQSVATIARLSMRDRQNLSANIGETVWLSWDSADARILAR